MKKLFNMILIAIVGLFLFACEMPQSQPLTEEDLQKIFTKLFADVDVDRVTDDLYFPVRLDGARITYSSSVPSIISNTGKVTRGENDEVVEVSVTLSQDTTTFQDVVVFTVLNTSYNQGGTSNPDADSLKDLIKAFANFDLANFILLETSYTDDEFDYSSEYQIDGNMLRYIDTYYYDDELSTDEYYFVFEGEEIALLLLNYEDAFYDVTEYSDVHLYYADYYYDFYDFNLNPLDFEYVDGTYYVKEDTLSTFGKNHLGLDDDYTVKEISLTLKDGYIYQIIVNSIYENDAETYDSVYVLEFKSFGEVELIIPEYIESEETEDIASVYEMEKGDEVSVEGIVMAYLGQNVYIDDGTASIVVFFKNALYIPEDLEIGYLLEVKGSVDIYNGLYEIVVTSADDCYAEEYYSIDELVYYEANDFSELDEDYMSTVFTLTSVKLSSLEVSSSKDTSITLTDASGNEMTLFVKKAQAELFNRIFAGVNAGESININALALTCYKTNLQFVLTEQTNVYVLNGFALEKDEYNVLVGTSLDNVLAQIDLKYYVKNELVSLNINDVSYETDYDESIAGRYSIIFEYEEEQVVVKIVVSAPYIKEEAEYDLLEKVAIASTTYAPGLPSTGDVNILVIPIKFNNSPEYDLSVIDIAFNSTNGETGWYSLKEYYQTTSYGKLNFSAHITDPYETNEDYNFDRHKSGVDDYRFFLNAITYFDEEIDYTMYDQNGDGYIDCVYLLYLAPVDYDGEAPYDMYWAYVYQYEDKKQESSTFDGLGLYYYLWASIEFFDEPLYDDYDTSDDSDDSIYVAVNCETIIHETGHALGLDDYYDYDTDKGTTGGVGGAFMMDANQGDHDPFSKAILGWTNPTVVFQSEGTFNLKSFAEFGDTIIIKKSDTDTYFDEYYVVSFYTPTVINELKHDLGNGIFGIPGVLILHIDASLKSNLPNPSYSPFDIYQFNNASTSHKLIKIVEADGNDDLDKSYYATAQDSDLFKVGDTLTLSWYDGSTSNITITVDNITDDNATISISLNS